MRGLMMDYQLTVPSLVRRAETLHARKEIVDRQPDGSIHRTTYGVLLNRARRLAGALQALGVHPGDRVATFCWNHHQHLEVYYGVPSMGAVLHTLNIRLHPDDLAFIAQHAGARVVIVDAVLLGVFEKFRDRVSTIEHVIVVGAPPADTATRPVDIDYETLIAGASPHDFDAPLDEWQAAAMCYTSGTTGKPRGVVYTHRSIVLHALGLGLADIDLMRESDTAMAIVPMYHANAWGTPYSALMCGTKQVLPGPRLDPASLLELLASERVTVAFGVPTVWTAVFEFFDRHPGAYDVSALRAAASGGTAVPPAMLRGCEQRFGAPMIHLWGMTETSPLGSCARLTEELQQADADTQLAYRAMQGWPVPLIEIRARNDAGLVPWDATSMGELEVRGPWVAASYYNAPETADRFTDDGWFLTGDIVTIDPRGYIRIVDRAKDVIKSGGEWVSSVALESALAAHPAVLEAAVVGVPHPHWDERPVAIVVRREGRTCTPDSLRDFLSPSFPKWWLPDAIEFVDALPKTTTGKILKRALRDEYATYYTRCAAAALVAPAARASPA